MKRAFVNNNVQDAKMQSKYQNLLQDYLELQKVQSLIFFLIFFYQFLIMGVLWILIKTHLLIVLAMTDCLYTVLYVIGICCKEEEIEEYNW